MSRLREIFDWKAQEVDRAKAAVPIGELKRMVGDAPPVRRFKKALEDCGKPLGLIAEVKKASPSRGLIREDMDPAFVATAYREAGADCLSVLTDVKYFQGSRANLEIARGVSGLPCLRKDFIFDEYQVWESRAWGADCILLIAAEFLVDAYTLTGPKAGSGPHKDMCPSATAAFEDLWVAGKELGMDVLVEVHSALELELALEIGADFIGVNNRNLADMSTSIETSETLLPLVSPHAFAISESALETKADLDRVLAAGARAVLIGTTFCSSPDIGAKVREVMG